MKHFTLTLAFILVLQFTNAQTSDTLLTIGENAISTEDFLRIYNKNSSIAEENQKSIDEYLDLFINYKLKVIEAENLGYDTAASFINEMAGYTDQLAKPYLDNYDLIDSFVIQAYERSLIEINASHILLKIVPNALPADTLKVYNKLIGIREQLIAGKDWNQVIDDESIDPNDKIGGDLGWFSVFRMIYPFETAAYNTPTSEISMPVRTQFGYHLIKVNDRRPTRGEVLTDHIMTMVPQNPSDLEEQTASDKINKAYDELQAGGNWNEVVLKYSEHVASAKNSGRLGNLNSKNAPQELLDRLYELDTFQYSVPFETEYGFHIVRPEEFYPLADFEEAKADLKNKVRSTADILKISDNQKQEKIRAEYGFEFNEKNLDPIYKLTDSSMFEGTWDAQLAVDLEDTVFFIGDSVYSQYDIAKILARSKIVTKNQALEISIRIKVLNFIDKTVLDYEMAKLPEKYPDYKNLLEEYHDGILLFNLTEDKVWRKAVEDTVGLEQFYAGLDQKYTWEKRIAITKYTYADSSLTEALIPLATKRKKAGQTAEDLSSILCPQDSVICIKLTELKYEKGDNSVADSLGWKKGTNLSSKDKKNYILYMVDDILKAQDKTLQDARGLYTADYQNQLEKEWVAELRSKYTIELNEGTLNTLKAEEDSSAGM